MLWGKAWNIDQAQSFILLEVVREFLGHVGTCADYFRVGFLNMLNVRLE
jgi:hypothetical protein